VARQVLQRCDLERRRGGRLSTGLPALDAALGGGVPAGSLAEIVSAGEGLGAVSMAFRIAVSAAGAERPIFLVDLRGEFYPPAAVRMGVSLERLIVVRPRGAGEAAWAMEQALRCRSVGAVVGWFGLSDASAVRRLQLAAEAGRHVGVLVHDESHGAAARFAAIRVRIEKSKPKRQKVKKSKSQNDASAALTLHRNRDIGCRRIRERAARNARRSNPFLAPDFRAPSSEFRVSNDPQSAFRNPQLILARADLHGGRWPPETLCVQLLKTGSTLVGEHDATGDVPLHAVPGGGPGESQHAAG
jgi:protein ImuA